MEIIQVLNILMSHEIKVTKIKFHDFQMAKKNEVGLFFNFCGLARLRHSFNLRHPSMEELESRCSP